jgi:phospholipid/cholesterol/gamma-HCH transport system substrate-binding protein
MIGRGTRPASTPLSPIVIIATAGTAIAALIAMTWVAFVAPRGVPGIGYSYVNAQFRDAASVPISTEVRIAGRSAGQVTETELRGGVATLRLQLRPGSSPVRSDARAHIRLKGLLGGKFVELDPGTRGQELPDGATLSPDRTSTAVDLLDIAQALDAPHRQDLQATLQGLGRGFAGRGEDVNQLLRAAAPMADDLRLVSEAVLARDGAAARLFPSLEATAAAFDPVRDELAQGLYPEASVLNAFGRRRQEIQRTLDVAPSTLAGLRGGLDVTTPLIDEVAGLAREAIRFTRPAPVALRETEALLDEARPAFRATSPLLRTLEGAVPPTLRLLQRVDPVTRPATRTLTDSLPPLVELGRRPCDLLTFARNWRSMIGFGVAPGSGDGHRRQSRWSGDLDDDAGLGAINSVRLILASPQPTDSLSLDVTPRPSPASAYPGPCQAPAERAR